MWNEACKWWEFRDGTLITAEFFYSHGYHYRLRAQAARAVSRFVFFLATAYRPEVP